MIGRWHSSCLHRNRVDFSLHQTLFKRQLRHFFHNCLVGKSVVKKTWKTILFPKKNVATKMYPSVLNWFFHEIMYFPKNTFMTNVFLWKYFYAWLYYDSLSQSAKIHTKYHFPYFLHIWIFTLKLAKITPVQSNVYFWRENTNRFHFHKRSSLHS